jgi:hypothetical protein
VIGHHALVGTPVGLLVGEGHQREHEGGGLGEANSGRLLDGRDRLVDGVMLGGFEMDVGIEVEDGKLEIRGCLR